jgi:hypothetical protein
MLKFLFSLAGTKEPLNKPTETAAAKAWSLQKRY